MMPDRWLQSLTLNEITLKNISYRLKTLLLNVEVRLRFEGTDSRLHAFISAVAKLPLKGQFEFESEVDLSNVILGSSNQHALFKNFVEHGPRQGESCTGTVTDKGILIEKPGSSKLQMVPTDVSTILSLAHAPFVFSGLPENFTHGYFAAFISGTPYVVRAKKITNERFEAAALKANDRVGSVSEWDWVHGQQAEITVRSGLVVQVEVTVPLMGRLRLKQSSV